MVSWKPESTSSVSDDNGQYLIPLPNRSGVPEGVAVRKDTSSSITESNDCRRVEMGVASNADSQEESDENDRFKE